MEISPEDEADVRALVAARAAGPIPMAEFTERIRSLASRGLVGRYQELLAEGGPSQLEVNEEAWYASPEFEEVRLRLVELAGDEPTGTRLARTYTSQGLKWVFEGRREPLDVDLVATTIWRRRHLFESEGLGDVLAWGQLREQLESGE